MVWPFTRRRPQGEFSEEVGIVSGTHRSPGLKALSEEMDRRPVAAVLDLGASYHENLTYLSHYCGNIVIRDLTSAQGRPVEGPRASLFQIEADSLATDDGTYYDAILLWDLLHYIDRPRQESFVDRLRQLSRPGALLLAMTSDSTPIPFYPVRFKIRDRESLVYDVRSDSRAAPPHFTPREVEKLMAGFRPVRYFQLRNGFQEYLFELEDEPAGSRETRPQPSKAQPGDWY